jgi:hypothetical protein
MALSGARSRHASPSASCTHGTRPADVLRGEVEKSHEAVSPILLERRSIMLWAIFVILLAMWVLGMVTSFTMGGFIHILLILAIAAVLIRIIQGRRPVV